MFGQCSFDITWDGMNLFNSCGRIGVPDRPMTILLHIYGSWRFPRSTWDWKNQSSSYETVASATPTNGSKDVQTNGWKDRYFIIPWIAKCMGPTWGPSGADRTQVGPMIAPWTLLSGPRPYITSGRRGTMRLLHRIYLMSQHLSTTIVHPGLPRAK